MQKKKPRVSTAKERKKAANQTSDEPDVINIKTGILKKQQQAPIVSPTKPPLIDRS